MELSLEEILARIDRDAAEAAAGISVSEEEILIKVADTERGLYSAINLTKTEILSTVADTERELRAILDIQSSAVTALVKGGGAAGQMSLSLELPVMIDAATRAKFVQAASEAEVSAVYAKLDGTENYAIKGNASNAAVKALWNKAVKAGLLASQIQLNASQIVVQNGDKTAAAFIDGKLRAACIDAENLIVQQLKIDSDKQSNQDFEAYFDKSRGLQIRNKNKDILKIDPKTGEAFFTGRLNATSGYFDNIVITGNSVFRGDIVSGPLELNDRNPSQQTEIFKINKGESSTKLYRWLKSKGTLGGMHSGNIVIDGHAATYYETFPGYKYSVWFIRFYDKDLKQISISNSIFDIEFDDKETQFSHTLQIGFYNPTGKTFKLHNLPTNEPNQSGAIWVDAGGFLRIKR